jgi:hypothetical protein
MDVTTPRPWSSDRFRYIETVIRELLCTEMQFADTCVHVVPVAGLAGQNLVVAVAGGGDGEGEGGGGGGGGEDSIAHLASWYRGPTLLQAIDALEVPPRPCALPLRAVVREVACWDGSRGRGELEVAVLQGSLAGGRSVGFYNAAAGSTITTTSSTSTAAATATTAVTTTGEARGDGACAVEGKGPGLAAGSDVSGGAAGGYAVAAAQVLSNASSSGASAGSSFAGSVSIRAGEKGTVSVVIKYVRFNNVPLQFLLFFYIMLQMFSVIIFCSLGTQNLISMLCQEQCCSKGHASQSCVTSSKRLCPPWPTSPRRSFLARALSCTCMVWR